jgi:hypothetical protein
MNEPMLRRPRRRSGGLCGRWAARAGGRNPSFFVEKLGAECSDLRGLRELTVNGLQAIAALGPGACGRVVWDVDWRREASGGRVRKLSVIR